MELCNRAEVDLVEISASENRINALLATKYDALEPDDKRILSCGYQKPNPDRVTSTDRAIVSDQLGGIRGH